MFNEEFKSPDAKSPGKLRSCSIAYKHHIRYNSKAQWIEFNG
jgi:hypothetical protein